MGGWVDWVEDEEVFLWVGGLGGGEGGWNEVLWFAGGWVGGEMEVEKDGWVGGWVGGRDSFLPFHPSTCRSPAFSFTRSLSFSHLPTTHA